MFCTSCGNQLSETDRFCPGCGAVTVKGAEAQPGGASGPARRLVRPMREKIIGGVCAGFAKYLGMDVTLMRVLWLCVAVFFGVGFIAYLICWIVMPQDFGTAATPVAQPAPPPAEPSQSGGNVGSDSSLA